MKDTRGANPNHGYEAEKAWRDVNRSQGPEVEALRRRQILDVAIFELERSVPPEPRAPSPEAVNPYIANNVYDLQQRRMEVQARNDANALATAGTPIEDVQGPAEPDTGTDYIQEIHDTVDRFREQQSGEDWQEAA